MFATVDYEYTTNGYKQTLKFYNEEKGKEVQQDICYIWDYIIEKGKIIGTNYSNNEQVFEKDEVLYDSVGRMVERNIYENGKGNFIYKYFY